MDCLSTVEELRNPEDIGVEVRNMHLARNQNRIYELIH